MLMTSLEKVSSALSEWGFKVASSFLPDIKIPSGSMIGRFMYGLLGVDPSRYNPWDELGFIAEPMMKVMITPTIEKFLSGLPEEKIEDFSFQMVDSFIKQAKSKGSLNVFGIQLKEDAFIGLKEIMNEKFGNENE